MGRNEAPPPQTPQVTISSGPFSSRPCKVSDLIHLVWYADSRRPPPRKRDWLSQSLYSTLSGSRPCPLSEKGLEYLGSNWCGIDRQTTEDGIYTFLQEQATTPSAWWTNRPTDRVKSAAWKRCLGTQGHDAPGRTGPTPRELDYIAPSSRAVAKAIMERRRSSQSIGGTTSQNSQ